MIHHCALGRVACAVLQGHWVVVKYIGEKMSYQIRGS